MTRDYSFDKTTAIFNCNYSCNDTCSFCFNKDFLNKSPELSMEEIKNNYYYLKEKYNLQQIIISGGEPSLYSHFWEMMDFFYNQTNTRPSLNTNSLNFADINMAKKLTQFLQNCNNPNKQLSLSFSTVNNFQSPSAIEQRKIDGIKNTIKAGLRSNTRTYIVLAITKSNYKNLPDLAIFLRELAEQYTTTGQKLDVQFRGLYMGRYMSEEQTKLSMPENWKQTEPHAIQFIQEIQKSNVINLKFFNIPLCLIQDKINTHWLQQNNPKIVKELRMSVSYNKQLSRITPNIFQETSFSNSFCEQCKWAGKLCNRVQQEYLDDEYINKLKPIILR